MADSPSHPAAPPRRPRFARTRRAIRFVRRACVWGLALLGALVVVMVVTPIPERMAAWLDVARELPSEKTDLIVCLGGQYERLLWTTRAYRRERAKNPSVQVVVSNAPGAAEFMKSLLLDCGLPEKDVLVDNRSYKTHDHPSGIAQLKGVDPSRQRLLIVTSHEHSRRVDAVFRKAGYSNFTIYGGLRTSGDDDALSRLKSRVQILPRLVYEYSALLQYWWQGRI